MEGFSFDDSLRIEECYEQPSRAHPIFYEFYYRITSLQRYFVYSEKFIEDYLVSSENSLNRVVEETSNCAVVFDLHSDMTYADKEYFHDTLYGSQLANIFSLFESLLSAIAEEQASEIDADLKQFLLKKKLPYIDKYLLFLFEECGIPVKLDKDTKKSLDALRQLRNRYVHQITSMISENLREELQKMIEENIEAETLNRSYVNKAFVLIGNIASDLEAAYWQRLDSNNSRL